MAITPNTIAATPDEYDFDSSDEEDVRNTVGNIPMQWYANLGHIGYDTSGRPIMKSRLGDSDVGDKIDEYLSNVSVGVGESGMEWRTVRDPLTDQLVILGDQDLETVIRIAAGKGVSQGTEPFEPWNEWFSKDVLQMPVTAHPPQKRSFIPSLLDRRRVGRMVHAIKMGWLKPNLPAWALSDTEDPDSVRRYAAYLTGGNLGALDSDDEEDTLGIPASSIPNYVFPDIWSDLNDGTPDATTTKGPPSLSDLLHNNYRPPRPRPYQRAPEEPLPGHIASYNPPPEFLLTKEERKRVMSMWRDRVHDGHVSRIPPLMPEQFACLRHVPFSERYLREREERVKDLLMAARVEKRRLTTTPEALLPPIPSLADLRPYPSRAGLVYRGHVGRVTDVAVSSCGQWVASISPVDGFLRIWETATNYCFRAYQLRASASTKADKSKRPKVAGDDDEEEEGGTTDTACVSWNPKPELCLIAASIGDIIYLINPALGDRVRVQQTNSGLLQWWNSRSLTELMQMSDEDTSSEIKRSRLDENIGDTTAQATPQWSFSSASSDKTRNSRPSKITEGHRVTICLNQPICSLDWHLKGDYLLTLSRPVLSSEILSKSIERIYLHRLSKMSSQAPFAMPSRSVEWRQVQFHPAGKPHVFVASPREIRVYDLLQQKELRCLRLDGSSDALSRMAVHPSGDHLVAGTFDGRFQWFDIDLGNVPFKKMGLGHGAVRNLAVHHTRPLVSVAMDDGTVLVVHATVSDDLLSKPLIIPVTLIRTGQPSTAASVLATTFHPRQPHMYTGGADGSVRQFVAWR